MWQPGWKASLGENGYMYMYDWVPLLCTWASQEMLVVKNLSANAGDIRDSSSIPGSGRSPGGGHGNMLQYSCLENSMDRGAWWATVHGCHKESDVTEWLTLSQTLKFLLRLIRSFSCRWEPEEGAQADSHQMRAARISREESLCIIWRACLGQDGGGTFHPPGRAALSSLLQLSTQKHF